MGHFVKLGKSANFFRDSHLDISVAKNEVVELNAKQWANPRIQKALNGGHLAIAEDPKLNKKQVKDEVTLTPEQLKESFVSMLEKNEDDAKIIRTFSREDLVAIAKTLDIEAEEGDTKKTLFEAIVKDLKGDDDEGEDNE